MKVQFENMRSVEFNFRTSVTMMKEKQLRATQGSRLNAFSVKRITYQAIADRKNTLDCLGSRIHFKEHLYYS